MKNIIIGLLILVVGWQLFFPRPKLSVAKTSVIVRDSIVRDTIRDSVIVLKELKEIRFDTIVYKDTITVPIPIKRYEFSDSSYKFVLEGYSVKPISVEIYPTTHYQKIESTKTYTVEPKRLSVGLMFGVGGVYGTKGVDFGLIYGVGVTYKVRL